ncbi:MAG: NAD(P)/FAD-dependent oxidoreductase [Geminicoccaceae bacterium]
MDRFDVVIVGAGMAGASLAWHLAPHRRVLLLERESQPGYHSTGRSAATLHSSYGNRTIRALTAASAPFYREPPADFSQSPLARPLGIMVLAREDQLDLLREETGHARAFVPAVETWNRDQCLARVPILRPEQIGAAMFDPTMLDLDVAAIHAGFLRGARARGVELRCSAEFVTAARHGDGWHLATRQGEIGCDVLVDAAGAWADGMAEAVGLAPLGIQPLRRTAIIVQAPGNVASWPMIGDIAEEWYVKPDAGRLLCSPADETPTPPCDAQPEELDVAICVDRIETAFDLSVRRIESRWAGLRSFAPDRTPVAGFDPRAPGFFWLAGQGGYGIQTAPALAALSAALICDEPAPDGLEAIDPAALSPARLLPEAA